MSTSQYVSNMKLNKLKGQASRIQSSGVFKTDFDHVAHMGVFLVTCLGNDESSPYYDADYPVNGVLFELVSGNETKIFNSACELKEFVVKHLEDHGARPSASIIFS